MLAPLLQHQIHQREEAAMGTSDDRFWAYGSGSPGWNYMATGFCPVGYATVLSDPGTFNTGGSFNGREFGVSGLSGPIGDWSLWPHATNYVDPAGTFGASALYTGTAGLITFGPRVDRPKGFPAQ